MAYRPCILDILHTQNTYIISIYVDNETTRVRTAYIYATVRASAKRAFFFFICIASDVIRIPRVF